MKWNPTPWKCRWLWHAWDRRWWQLGREDIRRCHRCAAWYQIGDERG